MKHLRAYLVTAMFVILISVVYIFVHSYATTTHANLVAGCHRGNLLRKTINDNNTVVTDFLKAAGAARQSAANHDTVPALKKTDQTAATAYFKLAARQKNVPIIDCAAVYK